MHFTSGLWSRLMGGAALSMVAASFASQAFAQSTGTQEVEKVVVTGARGATGGLIIKEKRPKTRSTVTQGYIATQPAGQTIFQSLNLVPGLNFTNSDPYGSSGGNVRLRGFDGNRISLTSDGIPLNDTGNYAIFTNQLVDPEYIERATVNTGTTDVDSPTASATGGTINTVTRKPYEDLTLTLGGAVGSFNYQRLVGVIDSGEYNGVSAFVGVSFQEYEKFKGPGELQKTQANARIYQQIGQDSFISVIGHYNENRNAFYRNLSKANIATFGDGFDNFATCTRDAANAPGDVTQNDGLGADTNNLVNPSSCTNFYGLRINPSNTGNIRAQASFALTDNFRLTIDPSWQYVKANGGGTTVVNETDARLAPLGGFVDINGDGDNGDDPATAAIEVDQIRTYSPNNTNTSRYGVTASLIWDIDDSSLLRVAYTGDHGRHRQTGAFSRIFADGQPLEIWGGLDEASARIVGTDGSFLRGRDRLSHAILNQVAASYSGLFFEDKLLIDVGLRAPFFSRDLNQFCYTQDAAINTVRCTTEAFVDADGDGIGTFASQGATVFVRPYSTSFEYEAVLPNVGVSYEIFDANTLYFSYAEGLSAPRTDNLYFAQADEALNTILFPGVEPEKTKAFDLGYRYQGAAVTSSVALWYNVFENRVVTAFDPDLGANVDRNVGKVELQGVDAEVGWRANDDLTVYASASYIESELQENIPGTTAGSFIATKGKSLVETPDWTFGGRVQYAFNEFLTVALQGKYVGDRFSNDINTEIAEAYTVFDANATVDLRGIGLERTFLQINATNIFDEGYLGNISSSSTGTATFSVGAPQTFQAQIKTQF
jgi:iron complex outermembrane receptor protein